MKNYRSKFKNKKIAGVILAFLILASPLVSTAQTVLSNNVWRPDQIGLSVTTDHLVYRTYRGGPKIVVTATIDETSATPVKVGDSVDRSLNATIDGFYAAMVGQGTTQLCTTIPPRCTFEYDGSASPATEFAFDTEFTLLTDNASKFPITGAKGVRGFIVFPVVAVTGTDEPLHRNPVSITVEVYKDKAAFDAAFAAAKGADSELTTVEEFAGAGDQATKTTFGTSVQTVPSTVVDAISGTLLSVLNIIIGAIVFLLRQVVWLVATFIIIPLLESMLAIDATHLINAIYFGWTFVRDITNMFFIIVLIIIGFGTMLKIETYNYKHLLVNTILMAVLVNFSLVIARIILQIADVATFTFLPNGDGVAGVRYLFSLLINDNITSSIAGLSFDFAGAFASTVSIIFQFILELGVVVTFGALAIFLLIRAVALWILLILSPFAYVLAILHATHHEATKWWTMFLKYAFFTPVMAFFLRLTILFYQNGLAITGNIGATSGGNFTSITDFLAQQGLGTGDVSFTAALELLTVYLAVLGFMWGGMLVAEHMGIAGANTVVGLVEKGAHKGAHWAGEKAWSYAMRKREESAKKFREKMGPAPGRVDMLRFALAHPVLTYRGISADSEEKREISKTTAEAAGREMAEQRSFVNPKGFWSKEGTGIPLPRVQQVEKAHADEFKKQYINLPREQLAAKVHEAFTAVQRNPNDERTKAFARGVYLAAMSKGYVDDATGLAHTTKSGREMMAKMATGNDGVGWIDNDDYEKNEDGSFKEFKYKDENGVEQTSRLLIDSSDKVRRAMQMALFAGEQTTSMDGTEEIRNYTLGDHAAARMITEDGEVEGKNTKHWEYMTDQHFDQEAGHYASYNLRHRDNGDGTKSWVSDGHEQMAGAELAKQERREQARIAWHSIMSDDGKDVYTGTLAKAKRAIISEPGFMQDRTAPKVVFNTTDAQEISDAKDEFLKSGNIGGNATTISRMKRIDKLDKELVVAFISGAVGKTQEEVRKIIVEKGLKIGGQDFALGGIEDIKKQVAEAEAKKGKGKKKPADEEEDEDDGAPEPAGGGGGTP